MYLVITFDVESILGESEILQALPHTLQILSRFSGIKCTFNIAARAVLINKHIIDSIRTAGHEIAAHGCRHDMDWNTKPMNEQEYFIIQAKKIFREELGLSIDGWATPRGNEHHADIALLKKHGFRYVRDRSFINYYQYIPPVVTDGFVDLPRFGYDDTGFMSRGFIQTLLKSTIFRKKMFPMYPEWSEEEIFQYLKNLLDYKRCIEKSYLVMNLHPFRIHGNPELEKGLVRFLEYVSSKDDVTAVPASTFVRGLLDGRIHLADETIHEPFAQSPPLVIYVKRFPEIALICNSTNRSFEGEITLKVGLFKIIEIVLLNISTNYGLMLDWDRKILSFSINFRQRELKFSAKLPPFSSSLVMIGRKRSE